MEFTIGLFVGAIFGAAIAHSLSRRVQALPPDDDKAEWARALSRTE